MTTCFWLRSRKLGSTQFETYSKLRSLATTPQCVQHSKKLRQKPPELRQLLLHRSYTGLCCSLTTSVDDNG